jgi:hypothetical protein
MRGDGKMGLFGDDSQDPARSQSNALIDQQFRQNQAEIEQKKRDLYSQRLDIIKSQGGQVWTPTR